MATKAPKPTAIERLRQGTVCPNCGKPAAEWGAAPKRGPGRVFCTTTCKRAHNNRLMAEGRAVIGYLKAWRIDRGAGPIAQESFSEICTIVDGFNAADLAAERPRADYYAATLLLSGRYIDRQRKGNGKGEREAAPIDQTSALRDKLADPAMSDNERAVLAAALEILSAPQG